MERKQDKTQRVGPIKFEACKPRYVIHLVIISPARDVYECYRSSRENVEISRTMYV